MAHFKHYALITLLSGTLSGCAVGPNFHSPPPPSTPSYTESSLPAKTIAIHGHGGQSQHFNSGQDIPGEWWTLFHSEPLNRLIQEGIANNPNLAAAQAALWQAQENYVAGIGSLLLPSVSGTANAERQNLSSASFGEPQVPNTLFNLYSTSVQVSYLIDVWGGSRRQIEALYAQVDYQAFVVEATYLTLTANIVTTSIAEASLRAQIKATNELIHLEDQLLHIIKQQFELGGVNGADVLTQETLVAQTRATLPPLEKQLSVVRDSLAALIGSIPSESHIPTFNLDEIQLPTELPISLPSSLVQQRPDIRAAAALLHKASANIGVATANLLPQLTISGNYGSMANSLRDLFKTNAAFWQYGTQLLQPIFNGGALLAQRQAAIAAFEQAGAQYQATVLKAFQNVADALQAIEIDARNLKEQTLAEDSAKKTLALSQEQFRLGAVNYLFLLTAERQYHLTQIDRIRAQADRYADTAALFQALGGGWWNLQPREI